MKISFGLLVLGFLIVLGSCVSRGPQKFSGEDIMCTGIYQPVCGENGKTYNNGCLADADRTTIACQQPCPCGTSSNSNPCDDDYRPVCGTNDQTYENACMARKADTSVACSGQCPC